MKIEHSRIIVQAENAVVELIEQGVVYINDGLGFQETMELLKKSSTLGKKYFKQVFEGVSKRYNIVREKDCN